MTRDKWLRIYAQRMMDMAGIGHGEAAASASEATSFQRQVNGRDPRNWDSPHACADLEMEHWAGEEEA